MSIPLKDELLKKDFWKIDKVSEYFNCSKRTIYRLISEGALIALKVRGGLRIPRNSIKHYIEAQIRLYALEHDLPIEMNIELEESVSDISQR